MRNTQRVALAAGVVRVVRMDRFGLLNVEQE